MDQLSGLLLITKTWTLFHWAGTAFGVGLVAVMGKAVYDEIRDARGIDGKFFIACVAVGTALVAVALATEANNMWRVFN
ncbi:MAG: hypothetical protein ACYC7H_02515 [Chloroflexota bacterium]